MSPRPARSQLSIYLYFHVCAKGNGGQDLFIDNADRALYLILIEKYFKRHQLQCFAYCLMTNHIHLLLLSPNIWRMSKAIHAMHTSYAKYFHNRYARGGHLFHDRFSSWVVQNQSHLKSSKRYIEENPVKAKLVKYPGDYPWSSAWEGDERVVTICNIKS